MQLWGIPYELATGFPAVDAKNIAVDRADRLNMDLLLLEDDILPDPHYRVDALVNLASLIESQVRLLSASCRNGENNVIYDATGAVLYAGTVAVYLPRAVLDRLPRPVFEAWDYIVLDGELVRKVENRDGEHSDTDLFYKLRRLEPRPSIRVVGHVETVATALNTGKHDLAHPSQLQRMI
jgi:hypothetical protein